MADDELFTEIKEEEPIEEEEKSTKTKKRQRENKEEEEEKKKEEEEKKEDKKFDDYRSVFVGKLNRNTTEADIRSLFSNCGRISRVNMPIHQDSGRPMGIAFVEFEEFEKDEAGDTPIKKACRLDGRLFMDSTIKVKPAVKEQKPTTWQGWRKDIGKADDDCTVHVRNLSYASDERTIQSEFAKCGKVVRVNIPLWHDTGRKRGFALVEFARRSDALKATKEINGKTIDGREVTVTMFVPLSKQQVTQQRIASRNKTNTCHGFKGHLRPKKPKNDDS